MSPRNTRLTLFLSLFVALCTLGCAFWFKFWDSSGVNETDGSTFSTKLSARAFIDGEKSLIPDLPKNQPPNYLAESFKYIAVEAGKKLWKIHSAKTFMYQTEHLIHARKVQAEIYSSDHQITTITGDEARYFLNQLSMEVFGHVHITLPDGFQLWSEYAFYSPQNDHLWIPEKYEVRGAGQENTEEGFIQFQSLGLEYFLKRGIITLLDQSQITLTRPQALSSSHQNSSHQSKSHSSSSSQSQEITHIQADRSEINRKIQKVEFKMKENRPLKDQFVYITQPSLLTRAREVDLHYGSMKKLVHYLIAREDVLLKESTRQKPSSVLRYATAGRAEFNTQNDIVSLKQFPQLYQDGDTVVGDVILLHRNSDLVEIKNSNAFSEGTRSKN